MKASLIKAALASVMGLATFGAQAKPTAYLPIGMDTHLEQQIDRLFIKTTGTPMAKPYRLSDIDKALRLVRGKDPVLYRTLEAKLKRYRGKDDISQTGVRFNLDHKQSVKLANQRGLTSDEWGQGFFEGIWRPNDYSLLQVGLEYRLKGGDLVPYNSFFSLAGEDLQLDVGYREHWFSPFKMSSQLISTNAKSSPSVTLGMVAPAHNWWNLDFELFYSRMEEVEQGILYQDTWHDGAPHLAGTRLSFEPLSGWKLGFNRIMQFGGGPREVGFSDIAKAFFDPSGNDNAANTGGRDGELGDQMASVTSSIYFDWGMPAEVYVEYAGEDTAHDKNYKLGNVAFNAGLYLPEVTRNLALRFEYYNWHSLWYVNALYRYGNTQDGFVFGHFGADMRDFGDAIGAKMHGLTLDYTGDINTLWQLKLLTLQNADTVKYDRANEIQLLNSRKVDGYRVETQLAYGKDVYAADYARASVALFW